MAKKDRVKEFIGETLELIEQNLYSAFDYYECETKKKVSPIEHLFYISFERLKYFKDIPNEVGLNYNQEIECSNGKKYYPDFTFHCETFISPPVLKGYSVYCTPEVPLLIELDGHIWHEKSPEKVEKDKIRERALIADGYTILRYSGREVYRDPDKIVLEAYREYEKRLNDERIKMAKEFKL